jgi:hypothetical protein
VDRIGHNPFQLQLFNFNNFSTSISQSKAQTVRADSIMKTFPKAVCRVAVGLALAGFTSLSIAACTNEAQSIEGLRSVNKNNSEKSDAVVEQHSQAETSRSAKSVNTPEQTPVPEESVKQIDSPKQAAEKSALEIPTSELAIAGIAIGDTKASVLERLGTPNSSQGVLSWITLEYDGLTVTIDEDGGPGVVTDLESTSPQYCTPSGICPGSSFAEVINRFGPPTVADSEEGQVMEYYDPYGSACWLSIKLQATGDNTIESVSIKCMI